MSLKFVNILWSNVSIIFNVNMRNVGILFKKILISSWRKTIRVLLFVVSRILLKSITCSFCYCSLFSGKQCIALFPAHFWYCKFGSIETFWYKNGKLVARFILFYVKSQIKGLIEAQCMSSMFEFYSRVWPSFAFFSILGAGLL